MKYCLKATSWAPDRGDLAYVGNPALDVITCATSRIQSSSEALPGRRRPYCCIGDVGLNDICRTFSEVQVLLRT